MAFYSHSSFTKNNIYNNSNNLLIDSSLNCPLSNKTFNELLTEHRAIRNELPFVIAKVYVKYNKPITNNSRAKHQHSASQDIHTTDKSCELLSQGIVSQTDTKNTDSRISNFSESLFNRRKSKEYNTEKKTKYSENLIFSAKQLSRELFENLIS
ncbi:hypothetical protein CDIK_3030, partial [Cucumispora dikerogammari]